MNINSSLGDRLPCVVWRTDLKVEGSPGAKPAVFGLESPSERPLRLIYMQSAQWKDWHSGGALASDISCFT